MGGRKFQIAASISPAHWGVRQLPGKPCFRSLDPSAKTVGPGNTRCDRRLTGIHSRPPTPRVRGDLNLCRAVSSYRSSGLLSEGALLDERYEAGEIIGSGRFGTVRVARDRRTLEEVAVKSVSKAKMDESQCLREISVMKRLGQSLSCCYLYGAYDTGDHIHLVMELCKGGRLLDSVQGAQAWDEARAASMVRSILRTVAQCHACNIAYRDVKPDNFLYLSKDPKSPLKGTDFGIARHVKPGEVLTDKVGTAHYMAPEVLRGSYGIKADVWSAGCVAYQLLSGRKPFADEMNANYMTKRIFRTIQTEDLDLITDFETVSESAKDLLRGLLDKDPDNRLSATEALKHPWLHRSGSSTGARKRAPLASSVVQRLQRSALQPKLKREALKAVARKMIERQDAQLEQLRSMFIEMGARQVGGWGELAISCGDAVKALGSGGFDLTEEEERQLVADLSDSCVIGDLSWECDDNDDLCEAVMDHDIQLEDFIVSMLDWNVVQERSRWQEWACEVFTDMFDADRDGQVTVADLRDVLQNATPDDLEDAMEEADTTGDGKLSMDEFISYLQDDPVMSSLDMYESRRSNEGP
mmetsp:Transcript_1367/g.3950  ORF Transcript_1367/g.3950 Transcript_1367/m.3950 type:complete len:583 (+) Transcript_1367:79-1827(+)